MISVLSIDYDVAFSRLLGIYLQSEGGFFLSCVKDGAQGCDLIADQGFDVILLESELPDISGFEILRSIRRAGEQTPVIMFTARGDNLERYRALDDHADMYLPKSGRFANLAESIRILHHGAHSAIASSSTRSEQAISLDAARRRARYRGNIIPLSEPEFRVLELLAKHPGEVIARAAITQSVRQRRTSSEPLCVEQCINSLRKKLGPGDSGRQMIRVAEDCGYLLQV